MIYDHFKILNFGQIFRKYGQNFKIININKNLAL